MMLWIYTCKTVGFVAQHCPQIPQLQNTAGFVAHHFYPQIQQDSWDGATIFGQHESCFGPDSVVV
jgi:hypothetical protein